MRAAERDDDARLLLDRLRAGLWVILACVGLFALGDLDVHHATLRPLYAVKLAHVVLLLALVIVVRRVRTWRAAVVAALVTVNGTFACIALTDVMSNHLDTTPLLPVVASMGAATLLPWGMRPQMATAIAMAIGTTGALACTGKPLADLADPVTSVIAALGVSVFVAYEFDRYRRDRRRAETALAQRARLEALRADVRHAVAEDGTLTQRVQACIEALVQHLGASDAGIWGVDQTGATLEVLASAGEAARPDWRRIPVGPSTLVGRVAAEGRPLRGVTAGGSIAAAHPVVQDGRMLGVVAINTPHALDAADLDALGVVSYTVGAIVERAVADAALARSQALLREEAAVSSALARVAEEMVSSLDAPVILERLCGLTVAVLGCDYSSTLVWRGEDDVYALVACHGLTAEERHVAERMQVPRETLAVLFSAQDDDVVEFRSPADVGRHLCIALRRGKDVVAVQVAGWRTMDEVLTPQTARVGRGISRVASMALANADLVAELERVSRLKSEFVSTMSHELRTPLNVILGYLEMARDPALADEQPGCLDRIETAGRELLELIESTLEIGRIEAGRAELAAEPVALAPFFAELGASCARLPRTAGVTLEWPCDVPDASVLTDPRKLGIVVRNLVGNACKFTERGSVRVKVAHEGESLVVAVADSGIGIRAEDQEVIFEMFRQADGSDSRRYGGTGLGLYIVRRFVQRLGGTVSLDSVAGLGSVFTVRLPWRAVAIPAVDAA